MTKKGVMVSGASEEMTERNAELYRLVTEEKLSCAAAGRRVEPPITRARVSVIVKRERERKEAEPEG